MDEVKITILEDGTIKMETDTVSGPNHLNAEQFVKMVQRLTGGVVEQKHKHGTSWHSHGVEQNQG